MRKKQKGFSLILAIAAVAIVVVVAVVFFSTQKRGLPTGTQQTTQSVPAIQDISGLNAVASELDSTNVDEIDTELNQLDTDASTF